MSVRLIRARETVEDIPHPEVGVYGHRELHRPREANGRARGLLRLCLLSHLHPGRARDVLELELVYLVVSPHEGRHEPPVCIVDEGLYHPVGSRLEEAAYLFYRLHARGRHPLDREPGSGLWALTLPPL